MGHILMAYTPPPPIAIAEDFSVQYITINNKWCTEGRRETGLKAPNHCRRDTEQLEKTTACAPKRQTIGYKEINAPQP